MLQYHKFANIFPMIEGQEYEELKKDIQTQGLLQPIVTYENKILDGRNRYKVCMDLDLKPIITNYKGDNPLNYVISLNLKRRHLNESQRAVIALDVLPFFEYEAKKRQIRKPNSVTPLMEEQKAMAAEQVGKTFNIGKTYIYEAKKIATENPQLLDDIRKGNKTISEIKSEIKIEKRKQSIKEQKDAIENGTIKLPKGTFEVIVIDPPWKYNNVEDYSPDYYMTRIANPYPEMSVEEIKNIKIPSAENCVLWLWTTHKFIFDCREILQGWGFRNVSILTWVKNKMGIGKWLRSKTEYCIMAVKGKPIINLTNQTTALIANMTLHSEKPKEFYEMVEELCIGRKLDYFGRKERKGWVVYGVKK